MGTTVSKRATKDSNKPLEQQDDPTPQHPWQESDYDGALTADQAAWRNRHIQRIKEDTKPAGEVVTK